MANDSLLKEHLHRKTEQNLESVLSRSTSSYKQVWSLRLSVVGAQSPVCHTRSPVMPPPCCRRTAHNLHIKHSPVLISLRHQRHTCVSMARLVGPVSSYNNTPQYSGVITTGHPLISLATINIRNGRRGLSKSGQATVVLLCRIGAISTFYSAYFMVS